MRKVFILLGLMGSGLAIFSKDQRYRVTAFGDNFTITSPFGSKVYIGDIDIAKKRSYRFEIMKEDLKPTAYPYEIPKSEVKEKAKKSQTVKQLLLEANFHYSQGELNKSLIFIEEAIQREPKNVRALTMKGSLMHAQGDSEMARYYWEKASKEDPSNLQLKALIGGRNEN